MALGKRGFKRSSSSTTSTVTTIVILGICVLGVWMLTGDSFEVPKATTSTTNTRTISNSAISLSNEPETIKTIRKNDQTTFRDNPGVLPSDAIQTDEPKHTQNTNNKAKKKDSTSAPTGGSDKQEKERASSVGESKISDEEKVNKIVEDSSQGLQGKESAEEQMKQREGETQISEESTLTDNQHAEQQQPKQDLESNTKANEEMIKQQLLEDAGNQTTFLETQNRIPNEDKLQRIKQHQEKQVQQQQEPPRSSFSDETIPQGQAPSPSELQAENVKNTMKHENQDTKPENNGERTKVKRIKEHKTTNSNSGETFPGGSTTGIPKESTDSKKSWSTQATQSENEKERRKDESEGNEIWNGTWHLCNETSGPDFIPCLDNVKAIKKLRSTKHYEHRERHCPQMGPTCLVPLPAGYKIPIAWPTSRDKIWYRNVPHAMLAQVKGHQNWVKVMGEFLTFPGGGTQFIHGALHYIDFIQKSVPNIAWGKRTRVVLDVGCGVASFGGYLFDRDVITMSFAPKDEHEAQVQFALERGIPAISAVMGSRRLPFPSNVFDLLHCARCRVPWHAEGGKLLMELNRVLRPGGYFVWSATPVYRKLEEDSAIWKAMSNLTVSMCWELVTIKMDKLNSAGLAIYRKPTTNECYEKRNRKTPPMCKNEEDPNAAWYVPLQACLHLVHVNKAERGSQWPEEWPLRLQKAPYWLNISQMGIYGKPAPQDFTKDYEHWKNVVSSSYMSGLGISWSNVRNVMDMRAVYGGFAAALKDLQVWVMNVVNINSPDTLPIIYERGLFGIYHDWCESFSSYPRSYDLLHADHLFSQLKKRCKLIPVMAEVDRLVRPGGKLIVRDESSTVGELENLLKSLHWEVHFTFSKDQEGILSAQKGQWRPDTYQASS